MPGEAEHPEHPLSSIPQRGCARALFHVCFTLCRVNGSWNTISQPITPGDPSVLQDWWGIPQAKKGCAPHTHTHKTTFISFNSDLFSHRVNGSWNTTSRLSTPGAPSAQWGWTHWCCPLRTRWRRRTSSLTFTWTAVTSTGCTTGARPTPTPKTEPAPCAERWGLFFTPSHPPVTCTFFDQHLTIKRRGVHECGCVVMCRKVRGVTLRQISTKLNVISHINASLEPKNDFKSWGASYYTRVTFYDILSKRRFPLLCGCVLCAGPEINLREFHTAEPSLRVVYAAASQATQTRLLQAFVLNSCRFPLQNGPFVKLQLGLETSLYVDLQPPSHCFCPCAHMASEKTIL